MRTRHACLAPTLVLLATAHCGAFVAPSDGSAAPADSAVAADVAPTPSCAEVRATCGDAPAMVVRGHAEGLVGLDGARAQFAVRYVLTEGQGLNVPHGVAMARAEVRAGAFEACVCVPHGSNLYPQVAAVVFHPGTRGETGADVSRAMFSQRYATLGDEPLTMALTVPATRVAAEVAVAAMDDRATSVALSGLDAATGSARVFAALVADERPVAAELAQTAVTAGSVRIEWIMPGRAWPSERVVLLVDRNANRRCDAGDLGVSIARGGRSEIVMTGVAWLEGAALTSICDALSVEVQRDW